MRSRITALFSIIALAFVASASTAGAQKVASICKDGTTSASTGRGTCGRHGGVDPKATKAAKRAAEKALEVRCTDGAMSKPGRGACSHHGGIAGASAGEVVRPPMRVPERPMERPRVATVNPSSRRGEDNDPTGAIAQCKDGMYSHASNHRGACSRHGGVAKFLK